MPPPFPMPPTFILQARFETQKEQEELHRLEQEIGVTFKTSEAKLVLGIVKGPGKAKGLLARAGLQTEIVRVQENEDGPPERKKRRVDGGEEKEAVKVDEEGLETMSEDESVDSGSRKRRKRISNEENSSRDAVTPKILGKNTIKVLELQWYYDSVKAGKPLPENDYFVYEGLILPSQKPTTPAKKSAQSSTSTILSRARAATPPPTTPYRKYGRHPRSSPSSQARSDRGDPPQLTQEDTEDHEAAEHMPPLPEYLKNRYSCQRPTPMHSPNDVFIEQLKIIRHARDLEDNQVTGHDFSAKSYSGAIASLKAYPYKVASVKELRRLPGCGDKVTNVWSEWHHTGEVKEVKDIASNERLKALDEFYGIHGVRDKTARAFYDEKGWRDLDDIIDQGWDSLNRDQQIGLKYYSDLQVRIPRAEVAFTESIILAAANSLHPGFQICTVGGYRRGKADSGDMDFILSHPIETVTQNFIGRLLDLLRDQEWIVHELTVSFRGSTRKQETLAWRGPDGRRKDGQRKIGSGFDTLDHAFVIWQNPNPLTEGEVSHLHRRVDIIISPWKTAGCAVLGWTGGTLFERDLRSYCRKEKKWKFDSSGIRDDRDGEWVDLESREGDEDRARRGEVTLEEKERRVFEGLGLEYRVPGERCTH